MPDKTFYTEADLPLAKHDTIVTVELEHGVQVQRLVFAGTRVPPDLLDGYRTATGQSTDDTTTTDYATLSDEDLQKLVNDRDLEVTGTGKDGNVLKADRVAALQAADQA